MTTPLEVRDLARRLLSYEAGAGKTSESMESATLSVYGKLRQSLVAFAGAAAFEPLAVRALMQAKSETSDLWAVQIAEDGSLHGLGEFGPQIDMNKRQGSEHQAGESGIILIARLIGLLQVFLGETLTIRLLREAWPAAPFDECNSEKRRKA